MNIKIKNIHPGVCKVMVGDDMTAYNAATQTPLLLDTLRENTELEIDLSEVGEMDSAGLKLLLLLRRTASRTDKLVNVIAHSKSSEDFISRFKLSEYFGKPMRVSGDKH